MDRMRSMVLVGVLTVSGLGIGASPAMAQVPSGAAPAAAPRSYSGDGNSYYPAAPTVPTPGGRLFYSAPSYRAPDPSSGRGDALTGSSRGALTSSYREEPTGRNVPLAKPWLRPLQ
jgi:hypothetical protein